jgi:hypothetical protein
MYFLRPSVDYILLFENMERILENSIKYCTLQIQNKEYIQKGTKHMLFHVALCKAYLMCKQLVHTCFHTYFSQCRLRIRNFNSGKVFVHILTLIKMASLWYKIKMEFHSVSFPANLKVINKDVNKIA